MSPRALSTDLYEITMLAGYVTAGHAPLASFELFTRRLPPGRGYLVAAGLEQALEYLEGVRFTPADIDYLRSLPELQRLPAWFFDRYLPGFRFTGDVHAVPEGTPVFAGEPLLRVTAPLPEAQLVETTLLALVSFQTSVASKAARVVHAAQGRPVVEFGARRAHGPEAAALAARAAYLAGCAGTSNLEAGARWGIPVYGTMAHSWVLAFDDELEAFRTFTQLYGERATLLLDTYDTVRALERALAAGLRPAAVRLDSGDLLALGRTVRRLLDQAGLERSRILVSGDLDEFRIAELLAAGAPVDGFGVGAALSTSIDAPSLNAVYKLVEVEGGPAARPVMKLSADKQTWPGRKQVWRFVEGGRMVRDVIALAEDEGPRGAEPLLVPVMKDGRRLIDATPLAELRDRAADRIAQLPAAVRALHSPAAYPVEHAPSLAALAERLSTRAVSR
ncbi:MAG TPA: nicotinate phosphoribosyltransferase [Vicinamibacterales bacterium]|nr:nicotinate phosphoribosyltransferase [Vicinamibacterales bacterium]